MPRRTRKTGPLPRSNWSRSRRQRRKRSSRRQINRSRNSHVTPARYTGAMRPLLLLALAAVLPLRAADAAFARAENKLDRIESGHARPGSVIVFTPAEMNAWARGRVPQMYQGIRDPNIQLGAGTATGSAYVDLLKMRQGDGLATNSLIAKLIEGERPLKVSIQLDSS